MNERLRAIRKHFGLTQRDICSYIGMSQSTYASMETGARPLKEAYLILICKSFHVNQEWLRSGKGKMLLDGQIKGLEELIDIFNELSPALQEYIIQQARELLRLQGEKAL